MDDRDVRERVGRIDLLLGELETIEDRTVRQRATETVGALVTLYGEALARAVGRLDAEAVREIAADELVAQLLLLHDLHPIDPETRVREALAPIDDVEVVAVERGVVRVRLGGGCDGCAGAAARARVEEAVAAAAPDVERVAFDGDPVLGVALPIAQVGG